MVNKDEQKYLDGTSFFEEKGFSSFRFNFYNQKDDTRNLKEANLSLHGKDLDTVTEYFQKKRY